jgi:CheY-like chemotaxis protein
MFSGSNEYLTKPFDPAKLLAVLGKYLVPSAATAKAPEPGHGPKMEPPPSPKKPIAVEKPAVAKVAVVKPTVAIPKVKGTERSVLVVEDSPTSRKVITMVLSRNGYVVSEAATGGQALRMVGNAIPHLILLDAMLPDMTGYDILAQLKQDQRLKEIPVVMLTAKDSPVDREKGMRAGSVAYLTKPFNPDKLLSVIGDYI